MYQEEARRLQEKEKVVREKYERESREMKK